MDFSNFTNINARITAWGGIKQTAFNKKNTQPLKHHGICFHHRRLQCLTSRFHMAWKRSLSLQHRQQFSSMSEDGARNSDSRYHVDLWKCS